MVTSSGSTANWNGKTFEAFVHDYLLRNGYSYIPRKNIETNDDTNQVLPTKKYLSEDKWFTSQFFLANTIYGTKWLVDFLIYDSNKDQYLVIECKWQQSGGSVDEKYPYLVTNIKQQSPYPCLVLLDGEGYKPAAKSWLISQIDEKLINVLNMSEFLKWFRTQDLITID
tara:strand:+ start:2132 stop:2638 length:507 start_codon:yes stop_codon:yes gene_type:complete